MDAAKAATLRLAMDDAFPDANVEGWAELEPRMRNHPKDRHVSAAAAAAGATIIVTSNIRDFRNLPAGIAAVTPDAFLLELLRTRPDELMDSLGTQAHRTRLRVSGICPHQIA